MKVASFATSTKLMTVSAVTLPLFLSSCALFKKKEPVVVPPKPVTKKVVKPTRSYTHRVNPAVNKPIGSVAGVSKYRGSSSQPYVALTFDDGPHATHTPRVLDILKSHNVKATFYVTGQNVARYPHIIRRMVSEGHEIGNHTYTHPNLTKLSDAQVRNQLNRTRDAIISAAGVKPRTFRAPYAAMTSRQRSWVNSQYGYPIVFWSVDPQDWKDRNASVVSSRILNRTKNGSIILLHDIHATSVRAVPRTINGLLSKGFKFVTVSQLLSN